MNAKIYIGPYVRGPEAAPAAEQPKHEIAMKGSKSIGGAFANLLPHRLFETSQNLFVIEVALLAILVGTMAAFLAGAIGSSLGVVLAMAGLLAGVLLVGGTIENFKNAKKPIGKCAGLSAGNSPSGVSRNELPPTSERRLDRCNGWAGERRRDFESPRLGSR